MYKVTVTRANGSSATYDVDYVDLTEQVADAMDMMDVGSSIKIVRVS